MNFSKTDLKKKSLVHLEISGYEITCFTNGPANVVSGVGSLYPILWRTMAAVLYGERRGESNQKFPRWVELKKSRMWKIFRKFVKFALDI